jgi:hypothetical protein
MRALAEVSALAHASGKAQDLPFIFLSVIFPS